MIFNKTSIEGMYVIESELKMDERGYFTRAFCKNENKDNNIDFDIVQINRSLTKQEGVIRGMHYQKSPMTDERIVQCLQGAIYDVVLDIRKNSPTFGKWEAVELTQDNAKMVLVPKGCAHGFQTTQSQSMVQYLVSNFYSPSHEGGIRWNDPLFSIHWPIPNPTMSPKDQGWPDFRKGVDEYEE
jgi:dTDP-4-dehydrorhamnose 3,5-epimerase